MTTSKLIQLLHQLSPEEMFRLRDFVQSPYHNKNEHVQALFLYLDSRYPELVPQHIDKQTVWQKLYPDKIYDDLKLRHVASLLLKVCEAFLQTEALREKPSLAGAQLLEAYRRKRLGKHFTSAKRALEQALEKQGALRIPDHYHQYQALLEQELMQEYQQERRSTTGLQGVADKLDEAYLVAKLKQTCGMVSYENIYRQAYRYDLLEPLLLHIEQANYSNALLLGYYHGLMMLRNPEALESFAALKALLKDKATEIPFAEAQELHIIARNFCIRRFNMGDQVYFKELFGLYQLGLETKVLLNEQGFISPSAFKNIVAVASRLEAFDWAEAFVKERSELLEEKYRSDYINYNLARLYFSRKQYGNALQLLNQVEYHDVFVAADARTLLLKTYFELDEYDALDALLESFKQFVTRRKELAYHKENYLNTIKFTRYLLNLNGRDKARKEALGKKIQATKILTEKTWLLEKLAER